MTHLLYRPKKKEREEKTFCVLKEDKKSFLFRTARKKKGLQAPSLLRGTKSSPQIEPGRKKETPIEEKELE